MAVPKVKIFESKTSKGLEADMNQFIQSERLRYENIISVSFSQIETNFYYSALMVYTKRPYENQSVD